MFKRRNKSNLRLNKKGFTLVEILIAVGILALITVPLAMNMITSSQINSKAKQTAAASDLTTTMLEVMQAVDLSDIITDVSGYKTDQYGSEFEYVLIGGDGVPGALSNYDIEESMEVIMDKDGNFIPVSAQDDLVKEYPSSIVVKKTDNEVDKIYFVGQELDLDDDGIYGEYAFLLKNVETDEMGVDVVVTMTPKETFDIVNISAMNQAEVFCAQQHSQMDLNVAAQYQRANAIYHGLNNSIPLEDVDYFLDHMKRTITIDIVQELTSEAATVTIVAEYTIDTDRIKDGDKIITEIIGTYSTNSTAEFSRGIYLYYYPLHNGDGVRDKFIINNLNELAIPVFLIATPRDGTVDYNDPDTYSKLIGRLHYTPEITVNELSDRVYQKEARTSVCSNVPNMQWIKTLNPLGNRTFNIKTLGNVSEQQTLYSMTVQVYRHRDASFNDEGVFTPRSKDLLIETTGSFIDTSEYMDIDDAKSTGLITEPGIATAWKYNDLVYNGTEQMGVDGLNIDIVSGDQYGTNAGTYSLTVKPKHGCMWGDGSTSARTFVWTITTDRSAVVNLAAPTPVYNGQMQEGAVLINAVQVDGTLVARDAGFYQVRAKPKENYSWSDGGTEIRTFTWRIAPRPTFATWATGIGGDTWNYDGYVHYGQCIIGNLIPGDVCTPILTNNAIKDLGSCTARIVGISNSNYAMPTENLSHTLKVIVTNAADIQLVNSNKTLTYNGQIQNIIASYKGVYITGTSTAKDVGTYTCEAHLMSGYTWEDGSTNPMIITWNITPIAATFQWGETVWGFDGENHATTCVVSNTVGDDVVTVKLINNSIRAVGTKIVTVESISSPNYIIVDGTNTVTIEIIRNPSAYATGYNFDYDGLTHVGVTGQYIKRSTEDGNRYYAADVNYDSDGNVMPYYCWVEPASNYAWSDTGTWEPRKIEWTIFPKMDAWYSMSSVNIYSSLELSPIVRQYNCSAVGDLTASEIGEYTITFKPLKNHVWKNGAHQGTARPITVTWSIIEWRVPKPYLYTSEYEYDGEEHSVAVDAAMLDGDAYSIEGTFSASAVGYYTVTFRLRHEGAVWEDGSTQPYVITWRIVPRPLKFTYVKEDNTWTYDSNLHTGTVTPSNIIDGDVVNFTLSNHQHKDADTYTFYVESVDNPNYCVSPDVAHSQFKMYINKRTVSINWQIDRPAQTSDEMGFVTTYDGLDWTVTATAGNVATNDRSNPPTFTYEDNVHHNAGTYYPKVTWISNDNYQLPTNTNTTLIIQKYVLALTWSTHEWVYDTTEHFATVSFTVPTNGALCRPIYDSDVGITDVGTKVRKVTGFTNPNYALPASGTSCTMKVTKRDVTLNWGDCNWVYDGTTQTKDITGLEASDWTVAPLSGTTCRVTLVNNTLTLPGEETCTATIDNNNYNLTNPTQKIVMDKAPGWCSDATPIAGWTYNGTEKVLIASDPSSASGTVMYSLDGENYAITDPVGQNAGTYTIYYYAAESMCYHASEVKTMTVVVEKAAGSYNSKPTAASGWEYDGNSHSLIGSYGSSSTGYFVFSQTNATNAGSYTVTYYCEGGTNYTDCGSGSFTVTVTPKKGASVNWSSNVVLSCADGVFSTGSCRPQYINCTASGGITTCDEPGRTLVFYATPIANYAWIDGTTGKRPFTWYTSDFYTEAA